MDVKPKSEATPLVVVVVVVVADTDSGFPDIVFVDVAPALEVVFRNSLYSNNPTKFLPPDGTLVSLQTAGTVEEEDGRRTRGGCKPCRIQNR